MKRWIIIPLLFLLFLVASTVFAFKFFAGETPPSGLVVTANTFYRHPPTNGIWLNSGTQYGWVRIARYSDITGSGGGNDVHKNDANGNLNWANKIITSNGNQIDKDTDTGTWYWNHVVSGSASSEPVTVVTDANGNTTVTSNGGAIL